MTNKNTIKVVIKNVLFYGSIGIVLKLLIPNIIGLPFFMTLWIYVFLSIVTDYVFEKSKKYPITPKKYPITLRCCDCGTLYLLTVEKIVDIFDDDVGHSHIVITCPECGLRHCLIFARLEKETKTIHVEVI